MTTTCSVCFIIAFRYTIEIQILKTLLSEKIVEKLMNNLYDGFIALVYQNV